MAMLKELLDQIRIAVTITLVLAAILCGVYPLAVWGLAQGLFPVRANGTLVRVDDRLVGSGLIGQDFTGRAYFHPRPSAAGGGYDGMSSGGSNLGPLSRELIMMVRQRAEAYRAVNNLAPDVNIPADAVTASASGLDPHISPANALLQLGRVARERGMTPSEVRRLIERHTDKPDLGFLGEERVHVLGLNLDLDGRQSHE